MGDDGGGGDGGFELAAELQALSLDAEVYSGYVEGIMDEEETLLEERVESVLSILGSATEEDLSSFGEGLRVCWRRKEAAGKAQGNGPSAEQAREVEVFQARLEAEKRAAEEAAKRAAEELQQRTRDREESRGREQILNKYAFGDDAVDEDGNVVAGGGGGGSGADAELGAMFGGGNANKAQVAEALKAQREAAKAQHAKKVAREKELLAAQKLKKEAEKRRTQKREKQRGCG